MGGEGEKPGRVIGANSPSMVNTYRRAGYHIYPLGYCARSPRDLNIECKRSEEQRQRKGCTCKAKANPSG